MTAVTVRWPDGHLTVEPVGRDWLVAAREAGVLIPTGCLGGSCGACEIEVNGVVVRACISTVPAVGGRGIQVCRVEDPDW